MKFIVDAMFGNLARWLRMSGYDTLYDKELRDGRMVMVAKNEGRALITRDRDVFSRAIKEGVLAAFISSMDFLDQLEEVKERFKVVFRETPDFSRCPVCNDVLNPIDQSDIKAKVPEKIVAEYEEFWICQGCGKIYWHGGHWKNIRETLEKLKRKMHD